MNIKTLRQLNNMQTAFKIKASELISFEDKSILIQYIDSVRNKLRLLGVDVNQELKIGIDNDLREQYKYFDNTCLMCNYHYTGYIAVILYDYCPEDEREISIPLCVDTFVLIAGISSKINVNIQHENSVIYISEVTNKNVPNICIHSKLHSDETDWLPGIKIYPTQNCTGSYDLEVESLNKYPVLVDLDECTAFISELRNVKFKGAYYTGSHRIPERLLSELLRFNGELHELVEDKDFEYENRNICLQFTGNRAKVIQALVDDYSVYTIEYTDEFLRYIYSSNFIHYFSTGLYKFASGVCTMEPKD